MKKKFFKSIVSLAIVAAIAVSTFGASVVSASASTDKNNYTISIITAGSDGDTVDTFGVKLIGTNGESEYFIFERQSSYIGKNAVWDPLDPNGDTGYLYVDEFTSDIDIGEIKGVSLVKVSGSDGFYPEYIKVRGQKQSATFYGGKWIDENQKVFEFYPTDNVYRLKIRTADVNYAGTDADVYATLYDENGNKTNKINLSDIYPYADAFERGDDVSILVSVPPEFGKLKKIVFSVEAKISFLFSGWIAYSISAEQISGANKGYTCSNIIKDECGVNKSIEVVLK